MTNEINKTARNPDGCAAAAAEALALRSLSQYRAARDLLDFYGGDLSQLIEPPKFCDLEARYAEATRNILLEPPDTASSEFAYLQLVEAIVADVASSHRGGPLMGAAEDLYVALQILGWLHGKANDRDISEGLTRERARRGGAGAAPPCRLVRTEKEGSSDEAPGSGDAA